MPVVKDGMPLVMDARPMDKDVEAHDDAEAHDKDDDAEALQYQQDMRTARERSLEIVKSTQVGTDVLT